jgi:hypothetical protein
LVCAKHLLKAASPIGFSRVRTWASTSKPLAGTSKSLAEKSGYPKGAQSGSPMNISARILKENRLRKAKAEKQVISRGCARDCYERIARAYNRTCSDVQVGIEDIPAIFRIVRVAMAMTPDWTDEALDRLVAATVESYRKN